MGASKPMPDTLTEKINPNLVGLVKPVQNFYVDPENARQHDERNLKAIGASLRHFGQQKPIVALASGKIIAGNGTFLAAHCECHGFPAASSNNGEAPAHHRMEASNGNGRL